MRNSIFGALVKSLLIFLLGWHMGIDGVVIALNVGIVVVTLLHIASITRLVSFTFDFREIVKILFAMFLTGWACYGSVSFLLHNYDLWLGVLGTLVMSGSVYVLCVLLLRLLVRDDVIHFPLIGKYLAPLFPER